LGCLKIVDRLNETYKGKLELDCFCYDAVQWYGSKDCENTENREDADLVRNNHDENGNFELEIMRPVWNGSKKTTVWERGFVKGRIIEVGYTGNIEGDDYIGSRHPCDETIDKVLKFDEYMEMNRPRELPLKITYEFII
jgi:hypothetical protein